MIEIKLFPFWIAKIKSIEEDPDKKWITTWNDYLSDIKYFLDGSTIGRSGIMTLTEISRHRMIGKLPHS